MSWTDAHEVCEALREFIVTGLKAAGRPTINRTYVGAGPIPFDDCCGQLVVQPEMVFRTLTFPIPVTVREECFGGSIAVAVNAVLVRCLPSMDEQGTPPTPEAIDAAFQSFHVDVATVWNVVMGELPDDAWERSTLAQTYGGNGGDCIACETRFVIGLDQPDWG